MVQSTKLNNQSIVDQLTEIDNLTLESFNQKAKVQEEKIKIAKEVFNTKKEVLTSSVSLDSNAGEFDYIEESVGLPKGTLYALMQAETEAYPKTRDTVVSSKGAVGAFQFMPRISGHYGIDPTNRHEAALAAAHEVKSGLKRYNGDIDKAIAAYNLGSGNFANLGNDLSRVPNETKQHGDRFRKYATPVQVDIPEPRLDTFAMDFLGQVDSVSGSPLPTKIPQLTVAQAKQALLDEQNALNAAQPVKLQESSVNILEQPKPKPRPDISTPGYIATSVIESKIQSNRSEIPTIPEDISAVSDRALEQGTETVDNLFNPETQYNQPISPVVDITPEGAQLHEDGLYSATDENGHIIKINLHKAEANALSAGSRVDAEARRAGAPPLGSIGNRITGFLQKAVDLGVQGISYSSGDTTLTEQVADYNKNKQSQPLLNDPETDISDSNVLFYKGIKVKLNRGGTLTKSEQAFQKSDKYQKILELEAEATENQEHLDTIQAVGAIIKSTVPTNSSDQIAAQVAFRTIAKNRGNIEAIMNAMSNDLGAFFNMGADSTPYMLAFTYGGPLAQTGILSALALGKQKQAISEFKQVNGRDPNSHELFRLKAMATAGTIFEKYGDLAAVRALPGKLSWVKQVNKTLAESAPANIAKLTVFRPTIALAGEGLSGGLTEVTEQLGLSGKITDSDEIVLQAFAEATGTVGGMVGLHATDFTATIARGIFQKSNQQKFNKTFKEKIENKINSTEPLTARELKDHAPKVARLDEIKKELTELEKPALDGEPVDPTVQEKITALVAEEKALNNRLDVPLSKEQDQTIRKQLQEFLDNYNKKPNKTKTEEENKETVSEDITDDDFQTTINSIQSLDTNSAVEEFVKLSKRKLTLEQRTKTEAAQNEYIKTHTDQSEPVEKPRTLGSLQENSNNQLRKLIETSNDETDKEVIAAQIKANQLKKDLIQQDEKHKKTLETVHDDVVEGQDSRWKGLITYLNEIIEATEDPAFTEDKLVRRIESIESNMQNHADNLAKKLSEFKKAKEQVTDQNKSVYVKATQEGTKGRSINYEILEEVPDNKQYVTEIHKNSTPLLEILEKEVQFSKELLKVALDYKNTSFGKEAALQFANAEATKHSIEALKKITFQQKRNESSKEDIKNIKNPIKNKFLGINWTIEDLKNKIESTKTLIKRKKQAFKDSKIPDKIAAEITELVHEAELMADAVNIKTGIRPIPDTPSASEDEDEDKDVSESPETTQSKEVLTASIKALQEKLPEDLSAPEAANILAEIGKLHEALKAISQDPNKKISTTESKIGGIESTAPKTRPTTGSTPSTPTDVGEEQDTRQPPVDQEVPDSTKTEENTAGTETITKESVRTEFPDVVTKEGKLAPTEELEGKESSLDRLAKVLDTTIDKIADVLASLPSIPNFLKALNVEFLSLITEDEISQLKNPSTSVEAGMQFVGQKFEDLIKFTQAQGIHSIPDSAFPDLALDHDVARLEQALKDLEISPESATILAKDYIEFAKRYRKVNLDKSVKNKNFIKQPLRILYRDGELPPQVVFSMMLGVQNWVNQHPTTTPFPSSYIAEQFLYGGAQKLDDDEKAELAKLGFGYQTAAKDIGSNIASLLKLAPKKLKIDGKEIDTSLYFENLIPALGLMAIEAAEGSPDDTTAMFKVETHAWNFDNPFNESRTFNNYAIDGAGNKITRRIGGKETSQVFYKHIKINQKFDKKADKLLPYKFTGEKITALKEVSDALGVEHASHIPLQEPVKVDTEIRNSLGGIPDKVRDVLKTLQNTIWTKSSSMDVLAKLSAYRSQLEKLIGVQAIHDNDHIVKKESLKSANDTKIKALDEILDAYNNASNPLEKFYFKYRYRISTEF